MHIKREPVHHAIMSKTVCGSKAALAVALSRLAIFQEPKAAYEQYATDSEVAADFLWTAYMQGDIKGQVIADLGAGTGILGIGSLLLGAKTVYFVEQDQLAVRLLRQNITSVLSKTTRAVILEGDVRSCTTPVATVIMNPPFGTKKEGADMIFLKQAWAIADCVYSMHKATTLDYLRTQAEKNKFTIFSQKTIQLPLKASMPFHTKRREYIKIVCLGMRKHL
jgi:putative methylase